MSPPALTIAAVSLLALTVAVSLTANHGLPPTKVTVAVVVDRVQVQANVGAKVIWLPDTAVMA